MSKIAAQPKINVVKQKEEAVVAIGLNNDGVGLAAKSALVKKRWKDAIDKVKDTAEVQGRVREAEAKRERLNANFKAVQEGVAGVKHAFALKDGKFDPDCVGVKIQQASNYIGEVFDGKQRIAGPLGQIVTFIPPMTDKERVKRLVKVSASGKLEREAGGLFGLLGLKKSVGTAESRNKDIDGVQGFVLGKEGDLYLFECNTRDRKRDGRLVGNTHGSVLGEKPVEMAGIMKIEKGKVVALAASSGHYRPDALDMYRGVKVLQKQGVMADDCVIDAAYAHGEMSSVPLKDFIVAMEMVKNGIPHHQELRHQRVLNHAKYEINHTGADAAKVLEDAGVPKNYKNVHGETALHWVFENTINKEQISKAKNIISDLDESLRGELKPKERNRLQKIHKKQVARLKDHQAKADEVLIKAIKSLVDGGYDINAKDNNGRTPMDFAKMHGREGGVKALEELQRKKENELKSLIPQAPDAVPSVATATKDSAMQRAIPPPQPLGAARIHPPLPAEGMAEKPQLVVAKFIPPAPAAVFPQPKSSSMPQSPPSAAAPLVHSSAAMALATSMMRKASVVNHNTIIPSHSGDKTPVAQKQRT